MAWQTFGKTATLGSIGVTLCAKREAHGSHRLKLSWTEFDEEKRGDPTVRRLLTIALSLSVLIGLSTAGRLMGQDPKPAEEKKVEAPKAEDKKAEAPKAEEKKAEAAATPVETKPAAPTEAALLPIPQNVQDKREAALKAIAEFIVAAQDAKLVESSIDPPPVLDLLVTGRAVDVRDLKARKGVSPEVFGAWFSGYGKMDGIVPINDVRIVQPAKGLKDYYDQRSNLLTKYIDEVRKAKGPEPTVAPKVEEKKPEPPKVEEKSKAEEKPKVEAPKAEDKPKVEAPKAEDKPKVEAPKADDKPKAEAPKAEEKPKVEEAPKAEAPKAEEKPKVEEPK